MSDMFQMFTHSPHSSGWQRSISPYTFTKVVLPCPYITLTWVHSLKRPDQTPSQDDDIFAIPLSEVCEHLITYPKKPKPHSCSVQPELRSSRRPEEFESFHRRSPDRVKRQCSNSLFNVTQKLEQNPPATKNRCILLLT